MAHIAALITCESKGLHGHDMARSRSGLDVDAQGTGCSCECFLQNHSFRFTFASPCQVRAECWEVLRCTTLCESHQHGCDITANLLSRRLGRVRSQLALQLLILFEPRVLQQMLNRVSDTMQHWVRRRSDGLRLQCWELVAEQVL